MFDETIKKIVSRFDSEYRGIDYNSKLVKYYTWMLLYGIKMLDKIHLPEDFKSALTNNYHILASQDSLVNEYFTKYILYFAREYKDGSAEVKANYLPELGDNYRTYLLQIIGVILKDDDIFNSAMEDVTCYE